MAFFLPVWGPLMHGVAPWGVAAHESCLFIFPLPGDLRS